MAKIKPPLPFSGNKQMWENELRDYFLKLPQNATVVDVFGGSGFCSVIAKRSRPDLRVVCNDFDNYASRMDLAPSTEAMRLELINACGLRDRSGGGHALSKQEDDEVMKIINRYALCCGYYDCVTIGGWFYLYTQNSNRLNSDSQKYNVIRKTPIDVDACTHWFDGIELVHFNINDMDLKAAYPGAFFILDPPYANTNCSDYRGLECFNILDKVMECVSCTPCILFGDVALKVLYEIFLKKLHHIKREKLGGSVFGVKRRLEIMYEINTDLHACT